jgi:hypothetical protein
MYIVTCPACNTANHGYAIECEKCSHSLAGLQRIQSKETTQAESRFWTHIYDLFIDGDDPILLALPQSNCFDCFSDKPTKKFIDFPNMPEESIHQSVGSAGGSGVKSTMTSRELKLNIPLCANCYYARNFVYYADPKFFDPNYRERPSVKRASDIWARIFLLSVVATILLFIFKANIAVYFLYATVTLLIIMLILNTLSRSYDNKLMKGLGKEVESRYTWFIRGMPAKYKSKKFFGGSELRWHWQLQFHNELYWELFKKDNQII